MRTLIVDDDPHKVSRLIEYLSASCGLRSDRDFVVASTGVEARKVLEGEDVDLLILDILLPMRAEEAPSENTSREILNELSELNGLKRPRQIVGLTAYEKLAEKLGPLFESAMWRVVQYNPTSEEWLRRIERCVKYIQEAQHQRPSYDVDLCIVNALADPEAAAVYRLPWNWEPETPLDESTFYRIGSFQSGQGSFSVASVVAPSMGMVSTALVSAKAIARLHPRFIVMGGICAGVPAKAGLGDVVLAERTWDYQSGKRTRDKENASFSIDPHQLSIPHFVKARAEVLKNDRVLFSKIKSDWPDAPRNDLRLVIGPMASGSAVLADGEVVAEIREQQRTLVAIEMEAYGLYAAAALCSMPRPTAFAMKSVCDFADADKNDDMQKYAAYTSAQTIRAFFEKYMYEIVDLAGT